MVKKPTPPKPISKPSDLLPGEIQHVMHPIKRLKAAIKQTVKKEIPVAGLVLKNSYEVNEQEQPTKAKKKVVLNDEGDTVEVEPEKPNTVKEAAHVLTYQERRKRSISMRRRLPKIKRARELAVKRMAAKGKIKKRSQGLARRYMRRRLAGKMGATYQNLSPSGKMAVDRVVSKKQQQINKLAARLAPRVRRAESARLATGKRASSYSIRPITQSFEPQGNPVIESIATAYDNVIKEQSGAGFEGTTKLVKRYKKDTPLQETMKKSPVDKLLGHLKKIEQRKKQTQDAVKQHQQQQKDKNGM